MKSWIMVTLSLLASFASYCHADDEFNRDTNLVVTPGTVIDASNVEQYIDALDEAIAELIRHGDTSVVVGEPLDFKTHPNYVAMTPKNIDNVKLGEEVGDLQNYESGRPFPGIPSLDDPRAGEKIAWNMRYGYGPDESETAMMNWKYRNMKELEPERTIKMYGSIMRFSRRHTTEDVPEIKNNSLNLFSALYLIVKYPQDIRNTQLLTYTNKDDGEPEQAFIFLTTQRKVKRLSTGQKTDAFLGSDIMIEDFLGYNGRIRDQKWEFLGTKDVLVPVYAFNDLPAANKTEEDGFTILDYNGAGNCFPMSTWQPRKVYMLRATPTDPTHPLKERIFTVDASTFSPLLTRIYDRSGKLWKLGLVAQSDSSRHLPENAVWQGPITDGVSMIDVQARHCTTISFRTAIPERGLRTQLFTPQQMRSAGR